MTVLRPGRLNEEERKEGPLAVLPSGPQQAGDRKEGFVGTVLQPGRLNQYKARPDSGLPLTGLAQAPDHPAPYWVCSRRDPEILRQNPEIWADSPDLRVITLRSGLVSGSQDPRVPYLIYIYIYMEVLRALPAKQGIQICRCGAAGRVTRPAKAGRSLQIYTRFHHDSGESVQHALQRVLEHALVDLF